MRARRSGVAAKPGGIGFWRFDVNFGGPILVARTEQRCRQDGGDDLFVAFPLRPIEGLEHNGTAGAILPGQAVLFDTAHPWTSSLDLMDQFTLQLPRRRLAGQGKDGRLAGRALAVDAALYQLLLSHAGGLAQSGQMLSDTALQASLDFLCQLAIEILGRHENAIDGKGRHERLLLGDAKREIARRLDDPALSVATIALALGVSRSALYRAFRHAPKGVNAHVAEARLERARALLMQDFALPIGEVALACGYENLWTFNRLFRRRFGCTPTEMRAASKRD
ncbi:MAG: AraC family transcriptional regulator [Alphaproteobacteria bacterium]|nr:AraC family transcriptional regulator [Alphaproteobacteria bacterium]